MEFLEQLDTTLFLFINGIHSPWFDTFFFNLSKPLVSLPMYLLVIYALFKTFQTKKAFIILGILVFTVGSADFISVTFFKEVFLRYRPSHNLDLEGKIHFVQNYKGGMYGFISSHAANTFAFACLSALLLQKKYIGIALFIWAATVSYSRIYLGVHYPADITCGALLGITLAFIAYYVIRHYFRDFIKSPK